MRYEIEVRETSQQVYAYEADSEEEALRFFEASRTPVPVSQNGSYERKVLRVCAVERRCI